VSLVLDASAALAWVYQDEISAAAQEILDRVTTEGAWVPAMWRLEIANGLNVGIRRGRINADYRDEVLATLAVHDIRMDADTWHAAWAGTLRLADRFGLTLYDAAYIELAQRRSLSLASFDGPMHTAARTLGLEVIGI